MMQPSRRNAISKNLLIDDPDHPIPPSLAKLLVLYRLRFGCAKMRRLESAPGVVFWGCWAFEF
jgi:hypothetical protein